MKVVTAKEIQDRKTILQMQARMLKLEEEVEKLRVAIALLSLKKGYRQQK